MRLEIRLEITGFFTAARMISARFTFLVGISYGHSTAAGTFS